MTEMFKINFGVALGVNNWRHSIYCSTRSKSVCTCDVSCEVFTPRMSQTLKFDYMFEYQTVDTLGIKLVLALFLVLCSPQTVNRCQSEIVYLPWWHEWTFDWRVNEPPEWATKSAVVSPSMNSHRVALHSKLDRSVIYLKKQLKYVFPSL